MKAKKTFVRLDEYRQALRHALRVGTMRKLMLKFAGRGRNGGPQWTEGMCPRRRRRAIARDIARREWREMSARMAARRDGVEATNL